MKIVKTILILMLSIVQISFGQIESQGFEKIITTIDFLGKRSDTTVNIIEYDSHGEPITIAPESYRITKPSTIDTIGISENERIIEYTWEDQTKSFTKEIKTSKLETEIGIDINGIDTNYYSSFKLGKDGLPIEGIRIYLGDTSKYIINEQFSLDEISEIQLNVYSDSEFIPLHGKFEFKNRKRVIITDLNENRNRVEIFLNKKLKPKKILKHQWHDFHKMIFKNKYIYKYESNRLIEIRNLDTSYGDLEMIRTIEYKIK